MAIDDRMTLANEQAVDWPTHFWSIPSEGIIASICRLPSFKERRPMTSWRTPNHLNLLTIESTLSQMAEARGLVNEEECVRGEVCT